MRRADSVLRLCREHPRHFCYKLESEHIAKLRRSPGTPKEVLKARNDIRQPFAGFDKFTTKIKPATTLSTRALTTTFVSVRLFLMIDP